MDEVTATLVGHAVRPGSIRRELFFDPRSPSVDLSDPDNDALPLVISDVTVRAAGETGDFALSSRGESVLGAALRLWPDLPYSCQEGVCATCRARVVSGAVVMNRCSGLDRQEQDDGYILTCQAHPVTATLVVDFDA